MIAATLHIYVGLFRTNAYSRVGEVHAAGHLLDSHDDILSYMHNPFRVEASPWMEERLATVDEPANEFLMLQVKNAFF